ncbi:hypothetical protein PG990_005237 [Apiospora arundinis]|uniref:F-box domain-containing protein n=1 Tax=Apiospora arundinis TaxID=335852 RepID=A0ABR2J857_9PEZI
MPDFRSLPPLIRELVFSYLIPGQRTTKRLEELVSQAPLLSNSLLAFCRASKDFFDLGLLFLYDTICIRSYKDIGNFVLGLWREPQLRNYVKRLYWVKARFNRRDFQYPDERLHAHLGPLGYILQVLEHTRVVSLTLPLDEVHMIAPWMNHLTATKTWTPPRTLIFQSYDVPGVTGLPEMPYIKLPGAMKKFVYCFKGVSNICLSPTVRFPSPSNLRFLTLEGIDMSLTAAMTVLRQCPVLEEMSWESNVPSWSDILTDNDENDARCLETSKDSLVSLQWVNRDYDYEISPEYLDDEVLLKPIRCFSLLAKLKRLRVDLECLTRATVSGRYLPEGLEELEVVVPCELDFHRHSYQPDTKDHEARTADNFFDWGDNKDTWLSMCLVKIHKIALDGLLTKLRRLVVDHELELYDDTLVATTKHNSRWKASMDIMSTMQPCWEVIIYLSI